MPATDIRTALAAQQRLRAQKSWWNILKQASSEWLDDDAMTWAAAVACYTLLALAPMLVIAIKIVALFIGKRAGEIVSTQAVDWMGPAAGQAVAQILEKIQARGAGLLASIVSLVLVFFSVGGVFAEFQQAMNRMWKLKPRPGGAVWRFLRARASSVIVMSAATLLLLASVFVTTWLTDFTRHFGIGLKYATWVIDVLMSIGVMTVLFAMVYRMVPDAQIGWRTTWMGAFVSAILFTAGKFGLAAYFKFAAPTSAFGAVGSLAAILIWIYYSAQIVFFGAEVTQVYAKRRGHVVRPSRHAQPLSQWNETETATPGRSPPGQKPSRPATYPSVSEQYAAVLGPAVDPDMSEMSAARGTKTPSAPRPHLSKLSSYVAASIGLAMGTLLGRYTSRARKPSSHGDRGLTEVPLATRIRRIEQKMGRASRIKGLLARGEVHERICRLEGRIRRQCSR